MTYTGREATPGTILTVISFGLLLIVNLITPIIKRLHFVKVSRKNTADELTIGLWGYCAQNSGEPKKCTSPKIGFAFDASQSLNPNLIPGGLPDGLPGAVNTTLSYLIVVHIVALVTLSIVTCVGASAHTRKNRDKGLIRIAAQSSALAFVFVLFAFIVDFLLFNNEIVKPINNKVGSVYLAEFDIAYYLVIACLLSSGLATISFYVGKIMNNRRRRKSEEESLENEENDDFYSEVRMNEDSREQNQNQNIPKYAEFEEDVVEFDAVKQSATQFPPGSEYFNSSFPPNQPQSYPMGPMGSYQGHGSRPISPNGRPGMPQQFPYPPQPSSSPTYHSAYNSYTTNSTTSPSIYLPDSYPYSPNQPPMQSYDTYPNSNSNIYRGYPPQSSHQWGQTQPPPPPPDNYYY